MTKINIALINELTQQITTFNKYADLRHEAEKMLKRSTTLGITSIEGIPGLPSIKGLTVPVSGESEDEDENPRLSDSQQSTIRNTDIAIGDERIPSKIPGGYSKGRRVNEFDPTKLELGMIHEIKEHTNEKHAPLAEEIAADHLTEDPSYYDEYLTPQSLKEVEQNNIKLTGN